MLKGKDEKEGAKGKGEKGKREERRKIYKKREDARDRI